MRSVDLAETPLIERCDVYLGRLSMLRPIHRSLLDPEEQIRSAEYRFDLDRWRFELGAALLRLAVARTVGWRAAAIKVDRTCELCGKTHGRPRVLGFNGHLSVSHSGDVVALAITSAGQVGIDVESMEGHTAAEYRSIVDLVVTPAERPFVNSRAAFLRVWTRKEAILKAAGHGLREPMAEVVVSPPYREPKLISLRGERSVPCFMRDIDISEGYCGALAVFAKTTVDVVLRDPAPLLDADRDLSS